MTEERKESVINGIISGLICIAILTMGRYIMNKESLFEKIDRLEKNIEDQGEIMRAMNKKIDRLEALVLRDEDTGKPEQDSDD